MFVNVFDYIIRNNRIKTSTFLYQLIQNINVENSTAYNLSNLHSGLYQIVLIQENQKMNLKLVVN